MPAIWSLCDVALVHLRDLPAFAEVIPSKIFEAMAMGLPILLAAPKGEAAEIVKGHGAGRWVAPEAPKELAAAVRALAEDEAARRDLAAAALAAAPAHSREVQAREMLAVFEAALQP
jgi:glycosyltransferase involved in cell wall biosynthesis